MFKTPITKFATNLLSKAMSAVNLTLTGDTRTRKIIINHEITPWVRVPNVRDFHIDLGKLDLFWALFGISKRLSVKITIEPYKNKKINRYVEHQIRRLYKARESGNARLYFLIADLAIKRSNCFRVLAINHVFPQWHRKNSLASILSANRGCSKLINTSNHFMNYSRVYVPKGNDTMRPLGVPSLDWRLLLSMKANFLTFYLAPYMKKLHGFLPGKGIVTAWKEIVSGLCRKPYIYEWDFQSFFDEIPLQPISDYLLEKLVPMEWVYFLECVNRSPVRLRDKDETDESRAREQERSGTLFVHPEIREIMSREGKDDPEVYEFMEHYSASPTSALDHLQNQLRVEMFTRMLAGNRGVPQGAATSPILANIPALNWVNHCEMQGVTVVQYADDAVGFGDWPLHLIKSNIGVPFAEGKCGYIKYAGEELKPLKFLGLELSKNFVRAHTRKGSRLSLSRREMKLCDLFSELHEKLQALNLDEALELFNTTLELHKTYPNPTESFERIFKNRIAGFVISRLQAGSWDLQNIEQCFNLKFTSTSWMSSKLNKYRGEDLDVFNSSSYANLSLLNLLRWNQKLRSLKKHARVGVKARYVPND